MPPKQPKPVLKRFQSYKGFAQWVPVLFYELKQKVVVMWEPQPTFGPCQESYLGLVEVKVVVSLYALFSLIAVTAGLKVLPIMRSFVSLVQPVEMIYAVKKKPQKTVPEIVLRCVKLAHSDVMERIDSNAQSKEVGNP